jgi:hypothetical protein
MDIHKPRRWHGWREFGKEVATIVLGVLIAIGAEQVVERLHWADEVRDARAALAGEMVRSNGHLAFRVAAEPCIARRLDALEAVTEETAKREPVPHLGVIIPDIGNALNDNVWTNYRAAQTLTHFDARSQAEFSAYYLQIGSLRGFLADETMTWAALRVLQGDPSRLGPVDIAGLRVALQHARFDNRLIAAIAADELDTARRLNIGAPRSDEGRLKDVCGPLPVRGRPATTHASTHAAS